MSEKGQGQFAQQILLCQFCGAEVTRNKRISKATCFDCRQKKVRERGRKYAQKAKVDNLIDKSSRDMIR